jgi:hypothetical protein
MKRFTILFGLLACLARAEPVKLFDGKSLDGWVLKGAPYWSVVDGVLIGESDANKHGSILWTKKDFGDFEIGFEFRFKGDIDSGVFLRHEVDQIQIGVSRSLKRDMTGSPYISKTGGYPVEAKGIQELLKPGEWNRMKIKAKGKHYIVTLNGGEVLSYQSETAMEKGPIGLQVHAGLEMKIEFRDLQIEVPE